ncbi:DNA cytosine methyltransferase [Streptomyces sp. NBC_01551]|uniref:DNA cytosine methyltransferase n=1 Tax=Streptomyces sp. NBC_01551 TaxID=2975876 RepID=UPI00224DA76B|nr:DNA cytosine methyltransferase [Streptomyces sp. NBC_01551]MCX4526755.1 DNA cytosine methyltransferase [Streptomyces sp. NBC_01551]
MTQPTLVPRVDGPRILSLCTGYGGLDLAVTAGLPDATVVAHAETDQAAARILAHHHPSVPNLGDITRVDWAAVRAAFAPTVITVGFPCQDISNAGTREGIRGERSGIWTSVAHAVRDVRPEYVFLENVAALVRRGLDVVAGDLATLGYDLSWTCLRASDIGAPHRRDRWWGLAHRDDSDPDTLRRDWRPWQQPPTSGRTQPPHLGHHTPAPPAHPGVSRVRMLPTPKASDGPNQRDRAGNYYLPGLAPRLDSRWVDHTGTDHAPAIHRWAHVLGHPAPEPTEPAQRGPGRRLAPAFAEWLMGVPGRVTTVPDLTRSDRLRAIGNGAVPQQGHAGYTHLVHALADGMEVAA